MGAFDDLIPETQSAFTQGNLAAPMTQPPQEPAPQHSGAFDDLLPPSVPGGIHGEITIPQGEERQPYFGDAYLKPIFGSNPIEDVAKVAGPALDTASDRPIGERITDTAAFFASAPQQALRLPSIGTGIESLTGYTGWKEAEDRFVENNPGLLRGLGAVGEVAPGVTRGLGQGVPRGPQVDPRVSVPPAAAPQRIADSATRIADDLAAFDRQGVRPLAPAMGGQTTQAVGKGLSEVWGVGKPLGNAIDDTVGGTRNAAQRVAGEISDEVTAEQLGRTVQQGVDRFTQQGFRDIEPPAVQQLGIDPIAPVQPAQQMGAGQARRLAQAQEIRQQAGGGGNFETSRGSIQPAGGARTETFTARRAIEDLSDAELGRIVGRDRAPARDASFRTRQEALYEVADRQLPDMLRINNSGNPQMMPATNLRQTWGNITQDIASSFTRQQLQNPLVQRLQTAQASNFTIRDLQAIRREIGRDLGRLDETTASLDRSQLSSLYRAISTDLENAYRDAASRAWQRTQLSPNRPDYVSPQQARQADAALKSFRRADRYTRASMQRLDRVMGVLRARTPEKAAQALASAARSGTRGNMGMLRTVRGMLRPEEFSQFQGYILRELGRPGPGRKGATAEAGFSTAEFVTNWRKLGNETQSILFDGPHRQSIDDIVRISQRVSNFDAMGNPSRTAITLANFGLVSGAGAIVSPGATASVLAAASPALAASVLLSRPSTARLMASYMRARSNGLNTPQAMNGARRLLARLRNDVTRPGLSDDAVAGALASIDREIETLEGEAGGSLNR